MLVGCCGLVTAFNRVDADGGEWIGLDWIGLDWIGLD